MPRQLIIIEYVESAWMRGSRKRKLLPSNLVKSLVRWYYSAAIAGWSSPVARRAHNPKVAGSNPAPATTKAPSGLFLCGLCDCCVIFSCGVRPLRPFDVCATRDFQVADGMRPVLDLAANNKGGP